MTPAAFIAAMDAWFAAWPQIVIDINATAAAFGVTKWITGTNYALGDRTWSPTDYRTYRCKVAGVSVTDPNADSANWAIVEITPNGANTLENLTIVPSVAANALTLTAKTQAAANPSNSDIVRVGMRSVTAASAVFNLRSITAALSLVIPSTATLGHSSALARDINVYLIDNAGALELAVSSTYFGQSGIVTTTAIAAASNSASTMYSTTARAAVPYRWVARFSSTQTVAGTWAAVPTVGTPINQDNAASGASLVLIQSQTASASATIDFTTGIDSTYDEYLFVFTNLLPAVNASVMLGKVSQDAGATWKGGGTDYVYGSVIYSDTGASANQYSNGGNTNFRFNPYTMTNVDSGLCGELRLFGPAGTALKKIITWLFGYLDTTTNVTMEVGAGGFVLNAAAVNGVRFYMNSGNIASGTIALYGVRKV